MSVIGRPPYLSPPFFPEFLSGLSHVASPLPPHLPPHLYPPPPPTPPSSPIPPPPNPLFTLASSAWSRTLAPLSRRKGKITLTAGSWRCGQLQAGGGGSCDWDQQSRLVPLGSEPAERSQAVLHPATPG